MEHVIAIDVNDCSEQAADMVIIQAIQEETVQNNSKLDLIQYFLKLGIQTLHIPSSQYNHEDMKSF